MIKDFLEASLEEYDNAALKKKSLQREAADELVNQVYPKLIANVPIYPICQISRLLKRKQRSSQQST